MSASLLFDSVSRIARHEASARPVAAAGIVTSIYPNDGATPDHAVTVKLRDSGLILPRVPVAVGAMGFASIPAVDDLVIVTFLEGDYHAPVVVGRLFHPEQEAPEHSNGQIVLRLPSGAAQPDLNCEINSEPVSLLLTLPGDVKMELQKDLIALTVGKIEVTLEAGGGGRLTAAAGGSSVTLKQDGDVSLKTSGKLKLEGSEVEIAGQAKVKITGAMVEIN
jgi:phage baseplate assembly protein gpV